jgi:hypothetical protein
MCVEASAFSRLRVTFNGNFLILPAAWDSALRPSSNLTDAIRQAQQPVTRGGGEVILTESEPPFVSTGGSIRRTDVLIETRYLRAN